MKRTAIFFVSCFAFAGTALAGPNPVFELIQGEAYVVTAGGPVNVTMPIEVVSGQEIVLKAGASGMVSSADTGCFVSLRTPGSYRVPQFSDCVAGTAMVLNGDVNIVPTNGYPPPPPPPVEAGFTPLVVSGVFVAGIAAAAIYSVVVDDPVSAN